LVDCLPNKLKTLSLKHSMGQKKRKREVDDLQKKFSN
jgi:hypothetical protein